MEEDANNLLSEDHAHDVFMFVMANVNVQTLS